MTIHVTEIRSEKGDGILYYSFVIMKSYLFVFLFCFFLFGIFKAIKSFSLMEGVYDGMIFGFCISIILVTLMALVDIFERIRCYKRFQRISFRVNQEKNLFIKGECDEIANQLIEYLKKDGLKLEFDEIKSGHIKATYRRSWRSFGERISIGIKESSSGILIEISSKPILFTTLFDFCKNLINIEILSINIIRNLTEKK